MSDDLVLELKKLIIETLRLEEIPPEGIEDDGPLFGEGLGLDSIDALELVVALEKFYGVVIPDSEVGKRVFRSVNTLARFVKDQQGIQRSAKEKK
jgi:acyl carrier protein